MPKEIGYIQDSLSNIVKLVKSGHIEAAKQILNSIPKRDNGRSAPLAIKQLAKCDLVRKYIQKLLNLFIVSFGDESSYLSLDDF